MSTQITGNSITSVLKKFAKKLSGKEIEGNSTTEVLEDFANKYDGGGGGSMLVTITQSGEVHSADKTFEEIKAAISSGIMPIAFLSSNGIYARVTKVGESACEFRAISDVQEGYMEITNVWIDSEGVTVDWYFPEWTTQ